MTMNAVTRWKTIATIAVAFSAGNLFATACGTGPIADANTAKLEEEVKSIKCVLRFLEDSDQNSKSNNVIQDFEVRLANATCGL